MHFTLFTEGTYIAWQTQASKRIEAIYTCGSIPAWVRLAFIDIYNIKIKEFL